MNLEDGAGIEEPYDVFGLSASSRKASEIRDITYRDLPCWYELSWEETKPAILLRLHQDFIKDALVMTSETPLVRVLAEELDLKNFNGNFKGDIGFEGALKNQGESGDFTEYAISIPKMKKETDRACRWCNGTGQDSYDDRVCFSCSGSKHDFNIDWQEAHVVSASLTAFTRLLIYCDKDTSASFPQLLTIETITEVGMHGGSLSADVSLPLRRFLSLYPGHNTIPEAIKAMETAYNKMFILREFDKYSFKTLVWDDGGLCMDCPGDACGVHPDGYGKREERGYGLSCHNVDSAVQQLTLIAGLAAIHDKARKEIRKLPD